VESALQKHEELKASPGRGLWSRNYFLQKKSIYGTGRSGNNVKSTSRQRAYLHSWNNLFWHL